MCYYLFCNIVTNGNCLKKRLFIGVCRLQNRVITARCYESQESTVGHKSNLFGCIISLFTLEKLCGLPVSHLEQDQAS